MPESKAATYPARVLSGIQPTGELTLGNYLGAVKNWVALQDTHPECYYCVVDYHAITVDHDPDHLRSRTIEMARDLLACGVDPERSALFVQSQVPEHIELAWIMASVIAYGDLSRMTQFKDKGEQQEFISVGLFTYPVLQAADILAYKATAVPVGEDQVQHLELCRGAARRFNTRFGETFPETEPLLTPTKRIMSPADPTKKMSKSLGPKHYIGVFEPEEVIRKKIRSHVTDAGGEARVPGQTSPGVANLLMLLSACGPAELSAQFKAADAAGTLQYKDLKEAVADHVWGTLREIQARRNAFSTKETKEILVAGAAKAQKLARETVREVRSKIGIPNIRA